MLTGTAVQIDYKKWRLWNNQNTVRPMYKPTANIFINKWPGGTQIVSLFDSDLKLPCSKLQYPGEIDKNSPAWRFVVSNRWWDQDSSGFNPKYACSTLERALGTKTTKTEQQRSKAFLEARTLRFFFFFLTRQSFAGVETIDLIHDIRHLWTHVIDV